jgi:hypothetical protein
MGSRVLAKPCRPARKATDGVRLSRRCGPFRDIAGANGGPSWGSAVAPAPRADLRGRAERCAVRKREHRPGRTAVHPCLSAPPSASCRPGGTTELRKPMVAPAGRRTLTGWRVNAAGCPATPEDYRKVCDRPMTCRPSIARFFIGRAEAAAVWRAGRHIRFACHAVEIAFVIPGPVPGIHVFPVPPSS